MKPLVLIMAFAALAYGNDKGQKEKRELIDQYLLNDGFRMTSEQFYEKQIRDTKGDFPNLPDSVWEEVKRNVHEEMAFLEGIIEMYMSRFSLEELREIKKAMESPAFKKYRDYMESKESANDFGMMAMEKGRLICLRITDYLKKKKYIGDKK